MIDIITPSGDRPIQFSLCVEWMRNQNFQEKVNWIIADDGEYGYYETPTMPKNWNVIHIKIQNRKLKRSSQPENILAALEHIQSDKIIMIEDDDYYHKDWLYLCSSTLDRCDIFGRDNLIQYNLRNRTYWDKSYILKRTNAMAQTSFNSSLVERLKDFAIRHKEDFDPLLDHHIWTSVPESKKIFMPKGKIEYVVGIKGLPGRSGMSVKHNKLLPIEDKNLDVFFEVLGEDVGNIYLRKFNYAR